MNVWIVTIGEPIINNQDNLRLHRHGLLANYISSNTDHKVIWWTSLFNHFTKKFEFKNEKEYCPNKNLTVKLIKGTGYKKNVSIARILDHWKIKKRFAKKILNEIEKPDVIIASFPTIGLCNESIKYGYVNKIPVLIDYRDLWPEAFEDIAPNFIKPIFKTIFHPLHVHTNRVLRGASGIIGITDNFLHLALNKINRKQNYFDNYFPHTYKKLLLSADDIAIQSDYWLSKSVKDDDSIKICFFGTLGHQFDLETVVESFDKLKEQNIKLIICGSGHKKEHLVKIASNNPNIIFPGYMNAKQIKYLLSISHIGLCPYLPKKMFLEAIPGKIIEYMSEGLELLTTLEKGVVGQIVEKNNFGLNYLAFDKMSFIDCVKKLCTKINNNKSNKQKIIKYYDQNFDQDTVLKKYVYHIEKVVENAKDFI